MGVGKEDANGASTLLHPQTFKKQASSCSDELKPLRNEQAHRQGPGREGWKQKVRVPERSDNYPRDSLRFIQIPKKQKGHQVIPECKNIKHSAHIALHTGQLLLWSRGICL